MKDFELNETGLTEPELLNREIGYTTSTENWGIVESVLEAFLASCELAGIGRPGGDGTEGKTPGLARRSGSELRESMLREIVENLQLSAGDWFEIIGKNIRANPYRITIDLDVYDLDLASIEGLLASIGREVLLLRCLDYLDCISRPDA